MKKFVYWSTIVMQVLIGIIGLISLTVVILGSCTP